MGSIRVWMKRGTAWVCVALVMAMCTVPAMATPPASCTPVSGGTTGTPPAFSDIFTCVFDTIGVYAVIAALLTVIVPLVLVVWGMRSGFSLIKSLFMKGSRAIART